MFYRTFIFWYSATTQRVKITALIVISLTLSSCAQEQPDLNEYVKQVKSQQQVEIEPLPEVISHQVFHYSADQYRNPFAVTSTIVELDERTTIEVSDSGIKPDQQRRKEILERYRLKDLKFVGSFQQQQLWGLIRTPEGTINRVQIGNYIGQNYGRVIAIEEDRIRLKEIVTGDDGLFTERENSLRMTEGSER